MFNFELFQREFFNPLKKNVQFSINPQAGLQEILTPLTCWPPPYCWVKNDQPKISTSLDNTIFIQAI